MNKGLSKYKRRKILMHFCEDIEASKTARLTGISRNTVNRYYNVFRERILSWQYEEVMRLSGEIEVDESYLGARRVRGKRGRGAAGKTPVFGLLKRGQGARDGGRIGQQGRLDAFSRGQGARGQHNLLRRLEGL